MKPQPPKPPEARTITYKGFDFYGFKILKVKHTFLFVIYIISILFSFLIMIESQDGKGYAAMWFTGNLFGHAIIMMGIGIRKLIIHWNNNL